MSALVTVAADGELRVSSLVVSERTDVQHKNVLELLRTNLSDFEAFGRVTFETRPFETAGGIQRREEALLNEHQATLLMTFMRNSEIVKQFKVELVKQFYGMRSALSRPVVPESFADALELAAVKVRELEAAEQKIALDAPKVAAYDALMDADGFYTMEAAAKLGGIGRNTLFARLRTAGVIQTGSRLPYQRYAHWFKITTATWTDSDGVTHVTNTPRVRPEALVRVLGKASVVLADSSVL
jgi:phage antirepressor YoqD-like protein